MRNHQRGFGPILLIILAAVVIGTVGYFVYNNSGSESYYIKVSQDSTKRFIILKITDKNRNIFIEGVEDSKTIFFDGVNLKHTLTQYKSIEISGVGTIKYKENIIKIDLNKIEVNGKLLPAGLNFILKENGELQEGFIRTFE